MVADESDPMIDAGSIGDIHSRESTPYLLCGHTQTTTLALSETSSGCWRR